MSDNDSFFYLDGLEELTDQKALYCHLDESPRISGMLYRPKRLRPNKEEGRIQGKEFFRISFSKTKVDGIVFRNCKFENCLFIGSEITNCEFHECRFVNTNTHKILINKTYIDPECFDESLDRKLHQNIGVHLYQMLLRNSRDMEQVEFQRDAHFLFLRWKRYQDLYEISELWKKRKSGNIYRHLIKRISIFLRRWVLEKFFGSGIRISIYLRTTSLTILMCFLINYMCHNKFGLSHDPSSYFGIADALYFTIISLTTLGYGDIVPTTSIGQFWAMFQSVLGFCLFALLASMLYRRFSP